MYWVEVLILLFLQGAQIIKRSFLVRITFFAYILSIIISFINSVRISLLQYISWHANPLGSLLLPPNRNISYFMGYVGWRFWAPVVMAVVVSLVLIWVLKKANKKYGQRFFESEEPYLAGTAIIALGYPGLLVYFVLFILIFLAVNLAVTLKRGGGYRISPYYLWIPASLIAILINELWLSHTQWWSQLVI